MLYTISPISNDIAEDNTLKLNEVESPSASPGKFIITSVPGAISKLKSEGSTTSTHKLPSR